MIAARPQCKHRAQLIDVDVAAGVLAGGAEPVADPAVLYRKRQPPDAALRRCSERSGFHDRAPEPARVDLEI